jgi:hypothetical protein
MDIGQDRYGLVIYTVRIRREMITCNRGCGVNNLHWKIADGNYKLFDTTNIMHICNDNIVADYGIRRNATEKLVTTLGLTDASEMLCAEIQENTTKPKKKAKQQVEILSEKPGENYFTITTTSNGIAITGDDKNNPIYLPKIAVKELTRALFDFI